MTAPVEAQDMSEAKVLILIADYFGWNYFTARDTLLDWGCNVTTVAHSLDYDVPSCLNRDPNPVVADLLLTEVDNNTLQQFDALLVTAGGQWQYLSGSSLVSNTIASAHDLGLLVASLCIANRVMVSANNIVNDTRVATYLYSNIQMGEEGAIVRGGTRVVSDNGIITGGGGGGFTPEGGFVTAPTALLCASIVKLVRGLTYLNSVDVLPERGPPGTNFTIKVSVDPLTDALDGILNTTISSVFATVIHNGNRSAEHRIALGYDPVEDLYTGAFTGAEAGSYSADIEIKDTNSTLEITRDSISIDVGTQLDPLIVGGGLAAGAAVLIAAIVILRRRS